MVWVARHARQSFKSLRKMPVSQFNNTYRQLVDIVSDEWSVPGE